MRFALLVFALLPSAAASQPAVVAGRVVDGDGAGLPLVNIVLDGSVEGGVTDEAGRFAFASARTGRQTARATLLGYEPAAARLVLAPGDTARVVLRLAETLVELGEAVVEASAFSSGDAERVTFRPLDVVTTPGAAADVFCALQTLPGVTAVDEGAGLYVRGGDVGETAVLLDGARLQHPYRYESATGGVFGSIPPFFLKGTFFSSGGFSPRYGDALSGVLAIETLDEPQQDALTASAGLAGLSLGLDKRLLEDRLGVRFSGNRSATALLFEVNGRGDEFVEPPQSQDANLSLVYRYAPAGRVKLFSYATGSRVGARAAAVVRGGLPGARGEPPPRPRLAGPPRRLAAQGEPLGQHVHQHHPDRGARPRRLRPRPRAAARRRARRLAPPPRGGRHRDQSPRNTASRDRPGLRHRARPRGRRARPRRAVCGDARGRLRPRRGAAHTAALRPGRPPRRPPRPGRSGRARPAPGAPLRPREARERPPRRRPLQPAPIARPARRRRREPGAWGAARRPPRRLSGVRAGAHAAAGRGVPQGLLCSRPSASRTRSCRTGVTTRPTPGGGSPSATSAGRTRPAPPSSARSKSTRTTAGCGTSSSPASPGWRTADGETVGVVPALGRPHGVAPTGARRDGLGNLAAFFPILPSSHPPILPSSHPPSPCPAPTPFSRSRSPG